MYLTGRQLAGHTDGPPADGPTARPASRRTDRLNDRHLDGQNVLPPTGRTDGRTGVHQIDGQNDGVRDLKTDRRPNWALSLGDRQAASPPGREWG